MRHAHRIFVIDEGRVVETVAHHELLEKGGRYAALYGEYVRV